MSMEQQAINPYVERPNADAIEKQREKYILLEVKDLYDNENSALAMSSGQDEEFEIAVDIITENLKKKHGISDKSSEKDKAQFKQEYPREVIMDVLVRHFEEE